MFEGKLWIYLIITGICLIILLIYNSFDSIKIGYYGLDYSFFGKSMSNKTFSAGLHYLGLGHSFI